MLEPWAPGSWTPEAAGVPTPMTTSMPLKSWLKLMPLTSVGWFLLVVIVKSIYDGHNNADEQWHHITHTQHDYVENTNAHIESDSSPNEHANHGHGVHFDNI